VGQQAKLCTSLAGKLLTGSPITKAKQTTEATGKKKTHNKMLSGFRDAIINKGTLRVFVQLFVFWLN